MAFFSSVLTDASASTGHVGVSVAHHGGKPSTQRQADWAAQKKLSGVLRTLQRLGVIFQRGGADARRGAGATRPLLHATGSAAAGFAAAARLLAKGDGLKVLRVAEQKKAVSGTVRSGATRPGSGLCARLSGILSSARHLRGEKRGMSRCSLGRVDVARLAEVGKSIEPSAPAPDSPHRQRSRFETGQPAGRRSERLRAPASRALRRSTGCLPTESWTALPSSLGRHAGARDADATVVHEPHPAR